jgi:hypothetical protein
VSDAPKFDTDKPRYDLLPPVALEQLARVYMYGVAKYGVEHGWRGGFHWCRIYNATIRHLQAWLQGEEQDSESGLPHTMHAAWNCFTLYELGRTGAGKDDRP